MAYGFSMGASWGDYDNDGFEDLYVSNMYSEPGRRMTARTNIGLTVDSFSLARPDDVVTFLRAFDKRLIRACGEAPWGAHSFYMLASALNRQWRLPQTGKWGATIGLFRSKRPVRIPFYER